MISTGSGQSAGLEHDLQEACLLQVVHPFDLGTAAGDLVAHHRSGEDDVVKDDRDRLLTFAPVIRAQSREPSLFISISTTGWLKLGSIVALALITTPPVSSGVRLTG